MKLKTIQKLVLASIVTLSTSAYADGINWTGPYAGINASYGYGDSSSQKEIRTQDGYTQNDYINNGSGSRTGYASLNGVAGDQGFAKDGGLGGLTVGYNYITASKFLVGGELDWSAGSVKGSNSQTGTDYTDYWGIDGPNSGRYGAYDLTKTVQSKISDLGTARLRLGFLPSDNLLVFATAGAAWGKINNSINVVNYNYDLDQNTSTTATDKKTKVGFVIGAGAEYAINQNIRIKAEYEYYDLGSTSTDLTYIANRWQDHSIRVQDKFDNNGSLIKVGINYAF